MFCIIGESRFVLGEKSKIPFPLKRSISVENEYHVINKNQIN